MECCFDKVEAEVVLEEVGFDLGCLDDAWVDADCFGDVDAE